MLKTETGILLLAIGHPYYGRMAYNLAMSIKAIDATISITLAYTPSAITHINQRNMWVFDNKMPIDDDSQPFGAKLMLDLLSPYERTLYIDVDTLWINKEGPSKLFDQLKGTPFTGITEGFHDYDQPEKSEHSKVYPFWADLEEIQNHYPCVRKIYQWRSEFMYFEKCEISSYVFEQARQVYESAKDKFKSIKLFADNVPDELAINISASIVDVTPHQYKWNPTFWDRLYGGNMPSIGHLSEQYYVISCGSNASFGSLKRVYDRVCASSAYKLRLQHVFPLISKKEMLINRQLM